MNKTVFGQRYRITEQAGVGGMAVVFKAQDEVLGRSVALKVLLPQYATDPTFAARFRQEAQAAANLTSPYIVNMYDWGCDEGIYYIVMEYVRGIDLKTAIKERGSIHRRKVAEIASQVCSALAVAHGYGIIHRDIKPQNLMVQGDGNVKVMDFGIARAGDHSMTDGSSVMGTAHYVSPEQAQGKELDGKSDLYSLGVVMYEAATGQLPFDAEDAVSVAMKQVTEAPVPPSQINPAIDADFEGIVLKALAKNPKDRFASASEMRACLNDYLAGRPVVLDNDATTFIPVNPLNYDENVQSNYNNYNNNNYSNDGRTTVMPAIQGAQSNSVFDMNNYDPSQMVNVRSNEEMIPTKRRKGPIIAIIAAVIAIIAIVLVCVVWQPWASNMVEVPDIVGLNEKDAVSAIEDAGLTCPSGNISEEYSEDVAEGLVISQSPEEKESVKTGTAISFVVSLGEPPADAVEVPNLLGMTASEAEAELTMAGLVAKQGDAVYDEERDPGTVATQSPEEGAQVDAGSEVVYCLSLGKKTVEIPDLVGKTRSTAKSSLEALNLEVVVEEEYSDSVNEDDVISVSPSAGSKVNEGSTVTITVSKGSKPVEKVTVPDLLDATQTDATNALTELGLEVKVNTTKSIASKKGMVAKQSVSAGTSVAKGSTVTITVGDGSEPDPTDEDEN